ncbi:cytoskeleton-associated protein 2 [Myripristis murdjan]|uniref:cytoskeleton-associated protein 2 n=1 Tax=Myripristis murdjan TaxID=586833 RepID=UPI001175D9AA|nr:cytoskeleton-associated protein 2 [Myripristis murdjan]
MDNVSVSRRNHINKKGNKENAQPACGSKTFSKINVSKTTTLAPLHLKSNEEETVAKDGSQKIKLKQVGVRVTSGEALKKAKQTDGKVGAAADAKKQQTLSQAFLTKQAVRQRKIVAEAPKPPAAVPPTKSAPGMYKGKIVQSKIGSIWKSSTAVGVADPKPAANPSAPKAESQRVGNLAKIRSKSVADLPGRGMQKPKPTRSNSVSDGLPPVSKRPITGRPMTGSRSALPPARTVPATVAGPSFRNTTAMRTKATETQSNKPKRPVTDKKVNKPPVSSTISQYRVTMETADERRAKLAEWLASKGKTLKRPAMAATHPKAKLATKPEVQSHVEPQPVAQCNPEPQAEPELSMDAHSPGSTAVQLEDNQRQEDTKHHSPPLIMNTTLELLDDSDMDLPEAEPQMNDIVVNLCDALEAMATPSRCEDEPSQTKDKCNDVEMEDSTPKDECQDHVENEMPEECSREPEDVEVKNETEDNVEKNESDDEIKSESDDEEDDVDDDDEEEEEEEEEEEGKDVTKTTPKMEGASVVKYSVKTTPYLQSVKKTIDGEVIASGSRRKSSIKDLKFLTPVRRSSRIQRKSSRLPGMLTDHDTCVSSLAELVKLDDEANAYIYRRNPALLEDLPDH